MKTHVLFLLFILSVMTACSTAPIETTQENADETKPTSEEMDEKTLKEFALKLMLSPPEKVIFNSGDENEKGDKYLFGKRSISMRSEYNVWAIHIEDYNAPNAAWIIKDTRDIGYIVDLECQFYPKNTAENINSLLYDFAPNKEKASPIIDDMLSSTKATLVCESNEEEFPQGQLVISKEVDGKTPIFVRDNIAEGTRSGYHHYFGTFLYKNLMTIYIIDPTSFKH